MAESEERKRYRREWARREYQRDPEKYRRLRAESYARDDEAKAKRKAFNKAYREANKGKLSEANREWQIRNPDRVKHNNLKKSCFTLKLLEQRLEDQSHLCALCERDLKELPAKHVHADHCHSRMQPRGVLCHWCNSGLGHFKDDPELLRKAIEYLELWSLLT